MEGYAFPYLLVIPAFTPGAVTVGFTAVAAAIATVTPAFSAFAGFTARRTGGIFRLPFAALRFEEDGLAAGANAVSVDFDDLYGHVFAEMGDIFGLLDTVGVELGDVDESLEVGEDLDDGADFEDALDLAVVVFPELGVLVVVEHHFLGGLHGFLRGGEDGDAAGILDVDGGAGGRGDGLDVLMITDQPLTTGIWMEAKILGVMKFVDGGEVDDGFEDFLSAK